MSTFPGMPPLAPTQPCKSCWPGPLFSHDEQLPNSGTPEQSLYMAADSKRRSWRLKPRPSGNTRPTYIFFGMEAHKVRCKGDCTSYRELPVPRVCDRTSSNNKASGLTRTQCKGMQLTCSAIHNKNLHALQMTTTARILQFTDNANDHDCFNLHALQFTIKTHITKTPGKPGACRQGTGRKGPWWPATGCSTTSHARTARWGRALWRTTPNARSPAKPTIERAMQLTSHINEQNLTYNR